MGDRQSTLRPANLSDLSRDFNFSEDEIISWYKTFLKTCPKGTLDHDEFQKLYCQIFPQGDASTFAGHVFRTFDKNEDGQLDFREFLSLVKVTGRGTPEEKLRWVFRVYDVNNDGYVTRAEMCKVITAMYKMAGKKAKFAADESTPEKRTEKIFERTDTDKDDKLSFKEFAEKATSDQLIAQLLKSQAS